jgi:putative hydrolase of the HAD superfamily
MAPLGEENKLSPFADWTQIDSILLDMDGTLLDLNFDLHFWLEYIPTVYSKKHGISYKKAREMIIAMLDAEQGKLNWYCLDYWEEKLKLDIMQLKKDTAHLIQVHEHVKGFLEAAREKKKRIYLVTNAHRKGIKLKMQVTQLQNYFDEIVSSHDFGIAKQEQEFWEHLMKVINFDKQRAILFDDSVDVLKSASKFEIKNIVAINKPSSIIDKKVVPGFVNIENFSQALPL